MAYTISSSPKKIGFRRRAPISKKRKKILLLGLLIFLLSAIAVSAKAPPLSEIAPGSSVHFTHLSVDDGLSEPTVIGIFQDSEGFMWFCTQSGLNRYDGNSFRVFRKDENDPFSLSNSLVLCLYEDSKKRIWVGTYGGGLNRFDRETERFTHYVNDPLNERSISNNFVRRIFEDSDGVLWIATLNGLNRMDSIKGEFTRYLNHPEDEKSISHNYIITVREDRNGGIWVGTDGGGINRLDKNTGEFTRYLNQPNNPNSLSSNSVRNLRFDDHNQLWITTYGGGLNRLSADRTTFSHIRYNPESPFSIASDVTIALFIDSRGRIWVGTKDSGVSVLDPDRLLARTFRSDPTNPNSIGRGEVLSILEDSEGQIWLGLSSEGLSIFNSRKVQFNHYRHHLLDPNSLSHNVINALFEDHTGLIWIATNGGGVNQLNPETGQVKRYLYEKDNPNSLSDNNVLSIAEDTNDNLWFGTVGHGVNRFNPHKGTFKQYRHDRKTPESLSYDRVNAIWADRSGRVWLGTLGGGLNLYDQTRDTFIHYRNHPKDPKSLISDYITSLFEDSDRNLWIGTINGLSQMTDRPGQFINYRHDPENRHTLSHNLIAAFYEDHKKHLWIGTIGGGLNRYNPQTEKFDRFGVKEGISNQAVVGILEDESNHLWLGTYFGLSRFNPDNLKSRNYFKIDGLQDNKFTLSALKKMGGKMYFGGENGITAFTPKKITENSHRPSVMITDLLIHNKRVNVGVPMDDRVILPKVIRKMSSIALTHKENRFSFEFAALSFSNPSQNRYAYQMTGFDKEWIFTSADKRVATYTNLNPGRYTFQVKGSNDSLIWSEKAATLQVEIIPAWWQTLWFKLMVMILTMGGLFILYQFRMQSVQKRRRMLEGEVETRTRQLKAAKEAADTANRSKSVFLASMSHELRTPLNTIMGFSDLLKREAEAGHHPLNSYQKENLNLIHKGGIHLLNLINNVLDLSKIEAGKTTLNMTEFDLLDLLFDLESLFSIKVAEKKLQLDFETSPDLPQYIRTDMIKLRQILINLIGNAIKFTEKGTIRILIGPDNEKMPSSVKDLKEKERFPLSIRVSDDGPGIPESEVGDLFKAFSQTSSGASKHKGTGLGLAISKEFIELMNGAIKVKSKLGIGTTFEFYVWVQMAVMTDVEKPEADGVVTGVAPGQSIYRILVVDDNRSNRDLLQKALTPLGFEVESAENGRDAIRKMETFSPHLVLMDIQMPEMDGLEATRIIKERMLSAAPKILALSASVFEDDRHRISKAGCDDFLFKPFRINDLMEKIRVLIDVTYIYQEGECQDLEKENDDIKISDQSFQDIPIPILTQLKDAAIIGDTEAITGLIEKINASDVSIAQTFQKYADDFDYPKISDVIEEYLSTKR